MQWKLENEFAVPQLFHRGDRQCRVNLTWHQHPRLWMPSSVRTLLNILNSGSVQLWGAEIIFSPVSVPCYPEATLEDFRCPDLGWSTAWHRASRALPHFSGIWDLVYSRQGCADQHTVHRAALAPGRSLVTCLFRSRKSEYLLTLLHTTLPWRHHMLCSCSSSERSALTISYLRCATTSMLSQSKEREDFFFSQDRFFKGKE